MKKITKWGLIASICLIFVFLWVVTITIAFAGQFNYGVTTYEQADDILIVNSLGDSTEVSTFGKLGTNDWISENAVKNYLALEGYSVANDYNPAVTNPQFVSAYNIKPGDDMTKFTFAGLLGNPRATQDVYVLTSEYNRLSATGQAINIDNLNSGLFNEINNRSNGDNLLQGNINNEIKIRQDADKKLGNRITKETKQRKQADITLQNNINTEQFDRISADNILQGNINTETAQRKTADTKERKARILGDKKLQDNINIVDNNSINRDTTLQNNINVVDVNSNVRDLNLQNNINTEAGTRASADNQLQSNISSINSRVDDVSNRVSKLEKTQMVAEAEFRVFDNKYLTISPFIRQNFTRSKLDMVGVRFTVKIGQSYEEREIVKTNIRLDMTEERLTNIEKKVGIPAFIEKTIIKDNTGKVKSTSWHIQPQLSGVEINGNF